MACLRSSPSIALFASLVACGGSSSGDTDAGTGGGTMQSASDPSAATMTTAGSSVTMTTAGSADVTGPTEATTADTSATDGGTTDPTGGDVDVPVGHCGAQQGGYFPASSWVYTDVSDAPVHPDSALTTAWLESHGGWGNDDQFQIDTSFVIVDADGTAPTYAPVAGDPIEYSLPDCDPDPLVPIPDGGRIEGYEDSVCPGRSGGEPEGDCHLIVADFSGDVLYEAYQASLEGSDFYASCVIAWDMTQDHWGAPPDPGSALPAVEDRNWGIGRDCTGPDAAGFPIAPLLFTVGDVMSGRVDHAIRFILPNDRMRWAPDNDALGPEYVWPATHAGGPEAIDPVAPVYGSRWRLRADFDPAARGLDPTNPVVIAVVYGLQHHGMLIADGGEIALSAEDASDCSMTWDDLWGEDGSRVLDGIRPSDFDIIDTGLAEAGWDCVRD